MPSLLTNIELLERLVAFDSVSRNSNLPIAGLICDYLDGCGFGVTRNPSADGTKANVVVLSGPDEAGEARNGLVLSGHMDVVPADEPEWESDPFTLTERGDSLFGRGTCDMKGFLAVAMNRMAAVDPAKLRHPLTLVFTYDEEVGTMGARRFSETWPDSSPLPRRTEQHPTKRLRQHERLRHVNEVEAEQSKVIEPERAEHRRDERTEQHFEHAEVSQIELAGELWRAAEAGSLEEPPERESDRRRRHECT